ncbi:MAG: carboxyltransferase domain-containing protein [Bdellovibrionales bacterium]|nr:carboxyltransferase domain-containing protein [Bdellovibrionales bacterium]
MIRPQCTWVSEDALLLRWEPDPKTGVSLAPQQAFHELNRHKSADILDLIPGACTLLVCFDSQIAVSKLQQYPKKLTERLSQLKEKVSRQKPALKIPMRYDGMDLDLVASHLGYSVPAFIQWHSSLLFRVAFIGFAPGFPYLVPTEGSFDIPRLSEPRVRVPSGSVALAGSFCGIYPHSTSGGWRIIGTSDVLLFDPKRRRAALLAPGDTVRFTAQ